MKIRTTTVIDLSRNEVFDIFDRRLDEIIGPYFIREDGQLRRHVDSHGRGSDWDEATDDLDDTTIENLTHAIALRAWTKTLCPGRQHDPHDIRDVLRLPNEKQTKCVHCQRTKTVLQSQT